MAGTVRRCIQTQADLLGSVAVRRRVVFNRGTSIQSLSYFLVVKAPGYREESDNLRAGLLERAESWTWSSLNWLKTSRAGAVLESR